MYLLWRGNKTRKGETLERNDSVEQVSIAPPQLQKWSVMGHASVWGRWTDQARTEPRQGMPVDCNLVLNNKIVFSGEVMTNSFSEITQVSFVEVFATLDANK